MGDTCGFSTATSVGPFPEGAVPISAKTPRWSEGQSASPFGSRPGWSNARRLERTTELPLVLPSNRKIKSTRRSAVGHSTWIFCQTVPPGTPGFATRKASMNPGSFCHSVRTGDCSPVFKSPIKMARPVPRCSRNSSPTRWSWHSSPFDVWAEKIWVGPSGALISARRRMRGSMRRGHRGRS